LIRLIVNADDFGFNQDVNEGILEAHRNGILTAATLMANGDAFEQAVATARTNPSLDVGCHLTLIGGSSVLNPAREMPRTVPELLAALARHKMPVYEEFRAQMMRVNRAGIRPTHLDTHKHTHLAWPVFSAVARIAREFGVRWVRAPFDFATPSAAPLARRLVHRGVRTQQRSFRSALRRAGLRSTDHFAGFQLTGHMGTAELLDVIERLPEGVTELMCHPGYMGHDLDQASTRLKQSREIELHALTAPEVRAAIVRRRVQLSGYV
jgi:chitin disaccharide deacetylase